MALTDAAMVVAANALRSAITHAQLHSGDPGGSGTSNTTTADREAISWSSATSDGDFGLASALNFTGVESSGDVTHITLWTASTDGTHMGTFALSGDPAANAAGEYTVTALNFNGSAS
jgi:hypothetical protein